MTFMETYSSLMAAKPDPVAHHPSKARKTTSSLDDFRDFEYHIQQMVSPRVRVNHGAKLFECSSVDFTELTENPLQQDSLGKQETEREKLQRHWSEVAGRVCIPEKWGQEKFLKDWTDYSVFDSLLAPKEVVSAREALVAERRRENKRCLKMVADQNGEQVLSFRT